MNSRIYLDLDNLSEAIDELQQMVRLYKDNMSVWARLADAYTRKGHLRAAVSSYEQLSEIEGGHEYTIPVRQILNTVPIVNVLDDSSSTATPRIRACTWKSRRTSDENQWRKLKVLRQLSTCSQYHRSWNPSETSRIHLWNDQEKTYDRSSKTTDRVYQRGRKQWVRSCLQASRRCYARSGKVFGESFIDNGCEAGVEGIIL